MRLRAKITQSACCTWTSSINGGKSLMNLRCSREPNSRGPTSGLKTTLQPTSRPSTCTIGNAGCIDTVRERQVAPFWKSTALKVTLILTPFHVSRGTVP